MKAMELSGVHLRRHVTITWTGARSERQYKVQGTLREIQHFHPGRTVHLAFDEKKKGRTGYTYYPTQSVPYYADVIIN